MRAACRPVVLGDRILIYYAGSAAAHGLGGKLNIGMDIGLATLRRDGWVSLEAGDQGGVLVTKAFLHPGGDLYVNADARGGSLSAVFLLDGHESAPSLSITEDGLRSRVEFASETSAGLSGKPVRLKLTLRKAKLYSFWFEK
jgi:hypothetical protein